MEDMNEQTWQSQIAVPASVMTLEDLQQSHAAIFDFAVKSVRKSMSDIIVALQVLEGDFCDKIFDIQKEQTLVMTRSPMPSQATIADFFANVTKVEQKLQVYESHAANLAHVKLTLARIAELVTKDGVLGTLVQKKTPVSTSFACSPTVQQQSLHLSRYSYPPIGPSLLFSAPSAPASMLPTNCFGQLVKPNDKHPVFFFFLPSTCCMLTKNFFFFLKKMVGKHLLCVLFAA